MADPIPAGSDVSAGTPPGVRPLHAIGRLVTEDAARAVLRARDEGVASANRGAAGSGSLDHPKRLGGVCGKRSSPRGSTATTVKLFGAVRAILNRHDLMHLIAIGCPEDEYEPEVEMILPRLRDAASPADVEVIVHPWPLGPRR